MYAQLGTILFQNMKGFTDFSKAGSASYAVHQMLDGKPKLQKTGNTLDEISLSMRFHASFCVPETELNNLKDYRDKGEIIPLLFGNGKLSGSYVIVEITETVEDADPQGNIFSLIVSCLLREYVTPNALQQEQDANRKKATAVGDKKQILTSKVNPPTETENVAALITKSENNISLVNDAIVEKGGMEFPVNRSIAIDSIINVNSNAESLAAICADPKSILYGNAAIEQAITQVSQESVKFLNIILTKSFGSVVAQNAVMVKAMQFLKATSRTIINKSILRL